MARTDSGKRPSRRSTGKPIGPPRDPEDDIDKADQAGQIKPLRPDKAWVRKNRVPEEADV